MKIIAKLHAVDKDIVEFYSDPTDAIYGSKLIATMHIDFFFTVNDKVYDHLTDREEIELELREI